MTITRSHIVSAPIDEVFAWFSRPGAFTRLAAPWLPARALAEADSLREGTTMLRLPGGLRWVARHDAAAFEPGRRFVDETTAAGLASVPAGLLPWRHEHTFEPVGTNRTRVIDTVHTPAPDRLLAPMLDYRCRQLTDDLAAHADAAAHGASGLTVAVTGSSGLVGAALTAFLTTGGHRVIRLVRRPASGANERRWDPFAPGSDLLTGVDAVIHLAGATIFGRFSDTHKRAIKESRIEPTRALARAAAAAGVRVFVGASAVGFYGADRGEESLPETAPGPAEPDFLSGLVRHWEEAAATADASCRVVCVRTGIVQSPRGGPLRLQLPMFRAGLGGPLGGGRQWQSWIGIDDLVDIYHRALWDTSLTGPVNAVAPAPVRNADYARGLGRVLHRPALLPVPRLGPRLLLGEQGARELAGASQRVIPARLTQRGHRFRFPTLEPALAHLLGRPDPTVPGAGRDA